MPNRSSKKRSSDVDQLVKVIVDLVTGNPITEDISPIAKKEKNPAAVALGRLGGLKGGKARAKALSAERKKEIARKAANARWKTNQK